jgi:hypothetical protein
MVSKGIEHAEAIAVLQAMLNTAPHGTFTKRQIAALRLALAALDWEYRFG